MPRTRKPAAKAPADRLDQFAEQLRNALEHLADAEWLGHHSPLASPYLLHELRQTFSQEALHDSPVERGRFLQGLLHQAFHEQAQEHQRILHEQFFGVDPHKTIAGRALRLNLSERTYYRQMEQAIQALADTLYQMFVPALRLEQPQIQPNTLQRSALTELVMLVQSKHSIYISGVGGVGKTTLGTLLAQQAGKSTLWYTVRPGLTDNLISFVFALAYFLSKQGAHATWRQLLAKQENLQQPAILNLLRYDLSTLPDNSLLICIDEIDLLQPERENHSQLLFLLEELRSFTSLLLLGQRVIMEADRQLVLHGFSTSEYAEWLNLSGLNRLSTKTRQQLLQVTAGNPALLTLIAALQAEEEEIVIVLTMLQKSPSYEAVFQRLWRRLQEDERLLLSQIAIFRTGFPADSFPAAQTTLQRLLERQLLTQDADTKLHLLSHIQPFVMERTALEIRSELHLRAALLLEARGEIIEAVHHYVQARRPELAIWLWLSHRMQRNRPGQTVSILNSLAMIDSVLLNSDEERTALRFARAEIYRQLGKGEEAEREINDNHLPPTHPLSIASQTLLGDILEQQGRAEHALQQYRQVLATVAGDPLYRQSTLHHKIAYLHMSRLPDLNIAKREARLARLMAETHYANIAKLEGDLAVARNHYAIALALAQELNDLDALAMVHAHLGQMELAEGDSLAAVASMEKAILYARQRGNMVSPLYNMINLSYTYVTLGQFTKAQEIALDGLTQALGMKQSYLIAGFAAAHAHASYELGLYDEAEKSVYQSIQQEEEFFRAWALAVLGLIYAATDRHQRAIESLHQAIEQAADINLHDVAFAQKSLGDVYQRAGMRQNAVLAYQKTAELYRTMNLSSELAEINRLLNSFTEE